MSKLTLKDVRIIGEGPQIRNAILQRYNSLEEFYEQHKVTKVFGSFANYLSKEVIISDTFKCRITRILDVDYPSLFVPTKKQIEAHVKNIYDNINLYEEAEDQETFDYLLDKCKKENMQREAGMMYRAKARVYYDTNWMNCCEEAYNYAIERLSKEDISYKVFFHCELAYDLLKECMYDDAEKKFMHIDKLLRLHKKSLNNTTMHHYYYWRGIMLRSRGSDVLSLRYFNKALKYAHRNIEKLNALSNIGLTYKILHKYNKAHEYYLKALNYHDDKKLLATASVYNNIANLFRTIEDYENAIINIDKAMDMSENENSLSKRLLFTSTYAEIKMDMGDKKAYKSFFELLLSSKGKKLYGKQYILNAIRGFIKYLDDESCLEEYADIIIEIKDASASDGYIKGLLECLGRTYDKMRKIKKGVYNEKAK